MEDLDIKLEELPEASKGEELEAPELDTRKVQSAKYTHFSKKKYLRVSRGKLIGCWIDSFAGACHWNGTNHIPQGAIVKLTEANKCPDGDIIVMCKHN
jgi:hypothetical protein